MSGKVKKAGPLCALHSDRHLLGVSRRRYVKGGLSAAAAVTMALALGAQAHAQEPEEQQLVLEEIQVTGSRIARTGFTTPVPVTSVEVGELRDLEPSNTIAEQLDRLPQFFLTNTAQRGGHAVLGAGQSHLNMRGVGVNRTLVLLDGSRVVPSDRLSSVNVDYLPSALMRRIEVVTGGASAAYGADALAGVTNFILDREFTGVHANMQGGISQFGDGESWQSEVAFGGPLTDRLHVIGSVEARKINDFQRGATPARADEVSWQREAWDMVTNPDWSAADEPGTNVRLIPAPHVHSTLQSRAGMITTPGFQYNRHTFTWDGTNTRQYQLGEYATVGGGQNNQSGGAEYHMHRLGAPTGASRNEVKQRSGFLGFDYEVSDTIELWGHGIIGRIESNSPGDLTLDGQNGIWPMTFYRDNPFLPDHIRQAMDDEGRESITIRTDSGWGCNDPQRECDSKHHMGLHSMYSGTLGLNMDLPGGWNMRTSYQYGVADKDTMLKNWQRIDRVFLALDAVDHPELGLVCNIQVHAQNIPDLEERLHDWAQQEENWVPRLDAGRDPGGLSPVDYPIGVDSVDGTIRDCVPLNPLGLGNVSPEAWRYIHQDKKVYSDVKQHFAEVLFTGVLHDGWGAGEIYQAVGATYRDERIRQGVPADQLAIDGLGPPMNVTLDINGESVPVVRGIPSGHTSGSPFMHRFSTYPTFEGGFDVWELFSETIVPLYTAPGGGQRVEAALAARYANYSRAGSVWTWKGGLDFQITDDLRFRGTYSRDVREGSFSEQFDFQAPGSNIQDPALDGELYLITGFNVGNPDIEPEEADTLVLGFVYQPSFLPGLSFSADYWDINLSSAIGQLGPQRLVDECFFNNNYCELIDFTEEGRVTRVRNPFLNIDDARVTGYDFEAAYRMQPNLFSGQSESFSMRLLAGYMKENSSTPLDGSKQDLAGTANLPKWSVTAMLSYNVGGIGMTLQQRYIDSTLRNINWVEGVDVASNRNPSAVLTSAGMSYTHDTNVGSWTGTLNVQNLFDRKPPIFAGGGNNMYDVIGRRYTAGVRFRY